MMWGVQPSLNNQSVVTDQQWSSIFVSHDHQTHLHEVLHRRLLASVWLLSEYCPRCLSFAVRQSRVSACLPRCSAWQIGNKKALRTDQAVIRKSQSKSAEGLWPI